MQRAVVLRVGVTIKQIENEHLQNELVFRVWIIGGGHKNLGDTAPECTPWLQAWCEATFRLHQKCLSRLAEYDDFIRGDPFLVLPWVSPTLNPPLQMIFLFSLQCHFWLEV